MFERRRKMSPPQFRHGFLKCSLMIYYLSQDSDFNEWWSDHGTTFYNCGY